MKQPTGNLASTHGRAGEGATHRGPVSRNEARRLAQQEVFDHAADLVAGLIENRGGNYQGIKFLFEFAGLTDDSFGDEDETAAQFQEMMRRFHEGLVAQDVAGAEGAMR